MPICRLLNTRTPRSAAFTTPISPGRIRTATPPMSAIVVLATVSADCAMNGLLEATFELSGSNRMPPNRLRMTQFSTLTARAPATNTPVDPTLAPSVVKAPQIHPRFVERVFHKDASFALRYQDAGGAGAVVDDVDRLVDRHGAVAAGIDNADRAAGGGLGQCRTQGAARRRPGAAVGVVAPGRDEAADDQPVGRLRPGRPGAGSKHEQGCSGERKQRELRHECSPIVAIRQVA